jgi:2-dehydropantoate 2-reductase
MQVPVIERIRDEIWLKLWGNVCLNPISALTGATLDIICSDPATRALSKAIMLETKAIAETFGVKFRVDLERRIEGARKVGAHKTSMLQDLERGRPMEIDPAGDGGSGNGALDGNSNAGARCSAGAGCTARENRRIVW